MLKRNRRPPVDSKWRSLRAIAVLAAGVAIAGGNGTPPVEVGISPSGHYFSYRGKTKMILCDSGTQCVMQNLNLDPRRWIKQLAAEGHPSAHIWAFVPPRQKLDGSKVERRWGYVYPGVTPWRRKTSGPAAYDGGRQWDLFSFDEGADPNKNYWPRLRDICAQLKQKGMMLGITVFFGWPKDVPGDLNYHPFYRLNGGPARSRQDITSLDAPGTEVHAQDWNDDWPVRKKTQWLWEKFCLKLIDETRASGNVWFDFRDEWSYDNRTNAESHFRRFFMSRGQVWADRSPSASFRVANPSVPRFGSTPAMKTEGGPYDADGVRVEAWTRAMSGIHYLLHNDRRSPGIMAWDRRTASLKGTDPRRDPGRTHVGHAARFFNAAVKNLDALRPNDGLVNNSARCLANPGREYAVYVPSGKSSVRVDLSAISGAATVRFYDVRKGTFLPSATVNGGASRAFATPSKDQDWALLIQDGAP